MYNFKEMQSTSSTIFQAYASWAATMMMIRSMANELIPNWVRSFIESAIRYLFTPLSTEITIVVDDQCGMSRNEVYDSAEIYLSKKMSPTTDRFKVNKTSKQKSINVSMEKNQTITDEYGGIKITWRFVFIEAQNDRGYIPEKRYFEVTFHKKHKDAVVNDYLPFVLKRAKEIKDSEKVVKLYTRDCPFNDDDFNGGGSGIWGGINLDHPATFDTLAMDPDAKSAIIEDLDRFVRRKDYYRKVGKAWKRGYLLYGPPGTGKSTLIAAMANYLKFDIYDLELTSIYSNSELRRILVSTTNRSIIVIEDIDCSVEMHDRRHPFDDDPSGNNTASTKLTLSGLLNFIDGLWSTCGDERIIIFTTNYKDKLDPALLRPGRMDLHIHMSYCTPEGFKVLALNYLGINEEYNHFREIKNLIEKVEVTPAEIAEELMRSEDVDVALEGVANFLKRKRTQLDNELKEEKTSVPKVNEKEEEEDASLSEADFEEIGRKPEINVRSLRRRTQVANLRSLPVLTTRYRRGRGRTMRGR